jgi:hypothetical protein
MMRMRRPTFDSAAISHPLSELDEWDRTDGQGDATHGGCDDLLEFLVVVLQPLADDGRGDVQVVTREVEVLERVEPGRESVSPGGNGRVAL